MMADRIAVIHQGDVVQDGTHTELMAETTGVYAELANKQMAKMALINNYNSNNNNNNNNADGAQGAAAL